MTDKLTKTEIAFLKTDHGYERIIHTEKGEIQAIKDGKRVFVGWNAEDVRRMNPAMIAALKGCHR